MPATLCAQTARSDSQKCLNIPGAVRSGSPPQRLQRRLHAFLGAHNGEVPVCLLVRFFVFVAARCPGATSLFPSSRMWRTTYSRSWRCTRGLPPSSRPRLKETSRRSNRYITLVRAAAAAAAFALVFWTLACSVRRHGFLFYATVFFFNILAWAMIDRLVLLAAGCLLGQITPQKLHMAPAILEGSKRAPTNLARPTSSHRQASLALELAHNLYLCEDRQVEASSAARRGG